MAGRALVTGATGFVGGRLALALAQAGWEVRAMVRDRSGSRADELEESGFALHEGNVLRPDSLRGAGQGVEIAYYLIHSMGRGGSGDFVARERAAAAAFAQMARTEGIERSSTWAGSATALSPRTCEAATRRRSRWPSTARR
jgi:uncharacterized protein YbjT (DUF2867 family)